LEWSQMGISFLKMIMKGERFLEKLLGKGIVAVDKF